MRHLFVMLLSTMQSIQKRNLKAVGKIRAVKLVVLGAYRRIIKHSDEINIMIKCRGETYDGYIPCHQLISDVVFTTKEG